LRGTLLADGLLEVEDEVLVLFLLLDVVPVPVEPVDLLLDIVPVPVEPVDLLLDIVTVPVEPVDLLLDVVLVPIDPIDVPLDVFSLEETEVAEELKDEDELDGLAEDMVVVKGIDEAVLELMVSTLDTDEMDVWVAVLALLVVLRIDEELMRESEELDTVLLGLIDEKLEPTDELLLRSTEELLLLGPTEELMRESEDLDTVLLGLTDEKLEPTDELLLGSTEELLLLLEPTEELLLLGPTEELLLLGPTEELLLLESIEELVLALAMMELVDESELIEESL
jgi:hypothetical protein